jgi:hypothetical protein
MHQHQGDHAPRLVNSGRWVIQEQVGHQALSQQLSEKNNRNRSKKGVGDRSLAHRRRTPRALYCRGRVLVRLPLALGTVNTHSRRNLAVPTDCPRAPLTEHEALPTGMPVTVVVGGRIRH